MPFVEDFQTKDMDATLSASWCHPSRYASGTLAFGLRKISDFPWTKGCKWTIFSPMAETMAKKKNNN